MKFLPILLLFCLLACEQDEEFNDNFCSIEWPQDTYMFPIKPGSEEWKLLTSSDQMDSVLLIPDSILNEISTNGLIQTCMNYPRLGDLFATYDFNFQSSFEILKKNFNGLQELVDRSDGGIHLFDLYSSMYPECEENNWSEVNLGNSFLFAWIEIMIAQYHVLNKLSKETSVELCTKALNTFQKKEQLEYSIFSLKTSLLISGRIMLIYEYSPFIEEYTSNVSMKLFIDSSLLGEQTEILKKAELLAEQFLLVK